MKDVLANKEKQYTGFIAKPYIFILVTILLLILPYLLKGSLISSGEDPYYFNRVSGLIKENGLKSYDSLSYSGREITIPIGSPLVLFLFNFILGKYSLVILPIVFGLLSLMLFYLILKELKIDLEARRIATAILLISPPFLYTFTSYNFFAVPTFIGLLAFYLFLQNKKVYFYLSVLLFALTAFFSFIHTIIVLILLFIYTLKQKQKRKFIPVLILSLIFLAINYLPILISQGLPELLKFKTTLFHYQKFFSDLGGSFGISIFALFLTFFGLSKLWEHKYKYGYIYLSLIILIIFTIINEKSLIYLNFILVYLAALGFVKIITSKWASNLIRNLTILLLICGLIFSGISLLNTISEKEPSRDLINALTLLNLNSRKSDVVFSHYSNGVWINSLAERPNVMDSDFYYSPDVNQRYNDSKTLLYTRKFDLTERIIDKYGVKYILVTKDMKNGLVWTNDEQGLQFFLKYSKVFKKIYDKNNIEIWEVKK